MYKAITLLTALTATALPLTANADQLDTNNNNVGDICESIMVADTFTPNGDSQNDTWYIENIEYQASNSVKVFNRWGNLVFEQKGYIGGWNGTNSAISTISYNDGNLDLPSGTYFYILNLGVEDRESYTGYVHIKK